jgi:hypothetical protein
MFPKALGNGFHADAVLSLERRFPDLMLFPVRGGASWYRPEVRRLHCHPAIRSRPNVHRLNLALANMAVLACNAALESAHML